MAKNQSDSFILFSIFFTLQATLLLESRCLRTDHKRVKKIETYCCSVTQTIRYLMINVCNMITYYTFNDISTLSLQHQNLLFVDQQIFIWFK